MKTINELKIKKPCMIALEGPDGCGKSTLAASMKEVFESMGYTVHMLREPGGTPNGEAIRRILLDGFIMDPLTELMLMMSARNELIKTTIKPILSSSRPEIIICDRFIDSSFAYQAYARGLMQEFLTLEKLVLNGFRPNFVMYLDISYELSRERLGLRTGKQDRLDKESEAFHKAVYNGYRERFFDKAAEYGVDKGLVYITANVDKKLVEAQANAFIKNTFYNYSKSKVGLPMNQPLIGK